MLILNKNERGIVVFKFFPNLNYEIRLFFSFCLIFAGIFLQIIYLNFISGFVLVLAGSLLQIVKGYNNYIKSGSFYAEADWLKFDEKKLDEIITFDKKLIKWDRSAIDASNKLGLFILIVMVLLLFILFFAAADANNLVLKIISLDTALLLIPHWVTGIREILRKPKLIIKIKFIKKLISEVNSLLKNAKIDFYVLLKGKKVKLPDDVKIKISLENQPKEFLGFYGQIVVNSVQGNDYPYFYAVIVTKKNSGLLDYYTKYEQPYKIVTSYSVKKDVEVFVIRQDTSIGKGYHTTTNEAAEIFSEGMKLAKMICNVK